MPPACWLELVLAPSVEEAAIITPWLPTPPVLAESSPPRCRAPRGTAGSAWEDESMSGPKITGCRAGQALSTAPPLDAPARALLTR